LASKLRLSLKNVFPFPKSHSQATVRLHLSFRPFSTPSQRWTHLPPLLFKLGASPRFQRFGWEIQTNISSKLQFLRFSQQNFPLTPKRSFSDQKMNSWAWQHLRWKYFKRSRSSFKRLLLVFGILLALYFFTPILILVLEVLLGLILIGFLFFYLQRRYMAMAYKRIVQDVIKIIREHHDIIEAETGVQFYPSPKRVSFLYDSSLILSWRVYTTSSSASFIFC
jgi:hypothetical protein